MRQTNNYPSNAELVRAIRAQMGLDELPKGRDMANLIPPGAIVIENMDEPRRVAMTYGELKEFARNIAQLAAPVAAQPIQGDVATGYQGWLNATWTPHSSDQRHPFDAFKAGAEWAAK